VALPRGLAVSATLRILKAGPGASVQDKGRLGFLRFGGDAGGADGPGRLHRRGLAAGDAKGAAIEARLAVGACGGRRGNRPRIAGGASIIGWMSAPYPRLAC